MAERRTIPRVPALPPAMDWAGLRAEGLRYLQQLSGAIWTDHNAHDPGITTLELLCYALTDLAYRTDHPTVDLLTRPDGQLDPPEISGLIPAHEVLTTAPRTVADYRRLLMRLDGVRNAWLMPYDPGDCEVPVFADCLAGALSIAAKNAADQPNHRVAVSGLWRVLADLEPDDRLGAMNEAALTYRVLRGPLKGAVLRLDVLDAAVLDGSQPITGAVTGFTVGTVSKVPLGFSTSLSVAFGGAPAVELKRCLIRVIEDRPRFDQPPLTITQANLRPVLEDAAADALVSSFFEKQRRRAEALSRIARALSAHRGLCEDFRTIDQVAPYEVGICADIELAPGADMEAVQAAVYHAIETYLAPPVHYRTLAEMLALGLPVETIFDGPYLDFTLTSAGKPLFTKPGFVADEDLTATELRREVHASDLINLIHDIDGVEAVKNLQLQAYDGNRLAIGSSESWTLEVPAGHQPVFFEEASKLLFYRAGIPYRAQPTEFAETLAELRALDRREVYVPPDQVLPQRAGGWRNLDAFHPVQHDFPATYKIGAAGMAPSEPEDRIARARQFKAYLTFFEQVLGDYLGQLANLRRLYSLDPTLDRSWFSLRLTGIAGSRDDFDTEFLKDPARYDQDLTRARLTETEEDFLERRNRLLDHLIARFSERFADYALMQFQLSGDRLNTSADLIADKIDFLKAYPRVSRERGQGANIRPEDPAQIWDSDNISGLERRAGRLVGIDTPMRRALACAGHFDALMGSRKDGDLFRVVVKGDGAQRLFTSAETFADRPAAQAAARSAYDGLRDEGAMVVGVRQGTTTFELTITSGSQPLTHTASFDTEADATRAARAILDRYDAVLASDLCNSEGMHLIEHILLRPRAADHALMPVCLDENCDFCGDEDPYSFRVSVVLPYWPERFRNLAFRDLVERTLREEAPAHVQVKICWVGQKQMAILDDLHREWLEALRDGSAPALKLPAKRLIAYLPELTTVYPAASLHDCDEGDDETPIRLGSTALGLF